MAGMRPVVFTEDLGRENEYRRVTAESVARLLHWRQKLVAEPAASA
jgi:hypothetical protein